MTLLLLVQTRLPVQAADKVIAYDIPAGTVGNTALPGIGFAMDFDVLLNIAITRLYLKQWPQAWADYDLRSEVAGSLDKTTRPNTPSRFTYS
jgi:hypothetical protein